MLEIFIKTFVLYFIVIDPLGTTPLFLIVTQHMEIKDKIKTALSATIIASIILLFFALLGSSLLSYLNISFPAFTIAGGIILFLISMEMLFDKRQQRKEDDLDYNSERVSVFPLATPLIAGPAGITSVIVSELYSRSSSFLCCLLSNSISIEIKNKIIPPAIVKAGNDMFK